MRRLTGVTRSLFFFSSRRRHTRWPRDWSSDVCSSDLRLFERLFNDHEMVWKTPHPRILMAAETNGNGHGQGRRAEEFRRLIRWIQAAAGEGPAPDVEGLADRAERLYA